MPDPWWRDLDPPPELHPKHPPPDRGLPVFCGIQVAATLLIAWVAGWPQALVFAGSFGLMNITIVVAAGWRLMLRDARWFLVANVVIVLAVVVVLVVFGLVVWLSR